MSIRSETGAFAGRRLNTLAALGFGAVFVVVGLAGFLVSGGYPALGQEGGDLLGLFQVNTLHNAVHLLVGAVMIAAGIASARAAKAANTIVGLVYLLLSAAGLLILGTGANLIALNPADNALHFVLGVALAAVGLGADRGTR